MFVGITNTPRDYAWGSAGEISTLLGTNPTGKPEAELWLGAHPGSPSQILDPSQTAGAADLAEWIARDSAAVLGAEHRQLPFLLKVLAAGAPLSLQAHPTTAQAVEGFARENEAGIPLSAPHRNYKDTSAKPELILAVSDTFDALCGFRPMAKTRASIERLAEIDAASDTPTPTLFSEWLARARGDGDVRPMFEWLISAGEAVPELVHRVTALAAADGSCEELALVRSLASRYAGDPGILIALMLNYVTLRRGEALFLPAGNIHAYVRGVGIELMASSDNVLRGGLTRKHVDVPELVRVLDFSVSAVPSLAAEPLGDSARVFRPPVAAFQLLEITGATTVELPSAAIMLCTKGEFELETGGARRTVHRGDSVFMPGAGNSIVVTGAGQLFAAATQ